MKNLSASVQEAFALRRMSLVQAVIELLQRHWPLSAALEQVASTQALPGEGETPPQLVARRTLEDWYYAFKQGGFEALKPKVRLDRGKPRRLSAKQQHWILEQVRAFPGVPVKLLYRQWKQADSTLPALSADYHSTVRNSLVISSPCWTTAAIIQWKWNSVNLGNRNPSVTADFGRNLPARVCGFAPRANTGAQHGRSAEAQCGPAAGPGDVV